MANGATKELASFLALALPGLRLRPGNYGTWPCLRFELGGSVPVSAAQERIGQAARRAAAIFEAMFEKDDDGFVTFTRWRAPDDDLFIPLLPEGARHHLERQDGVDFYGHGSDERLPHTTYTVRLRPRDLDYERAFTLVARAELGESPSLGGRVYLVNRRCPFVFHMYDDRGAILIARDERRLAGVKETFAHWLVSD